MIQPLCSQKGSVPLTVLDVVCGKAARVAHVVPAARPFVAGLWGALSASRTADRLGRREAPPHHAPAKRFAFAAAWVKALLSEEEACPIPLERLVSPAPPPAASTASWRVEFDASVFGGGAVLRDESGAVREFFSAVWDGSEAVRLHVVPGLPKFQTF